MNFQAVRNNPGKYEQMQGTAVKFDIKTGEYGNYALGKMTDNLGETVKMFYASSDDSPCPDIGCMNKLGIWSVRFDANKGQYKAYFNSLVAQQLQPPQGSPQGHQNAPQGTKPPPGIDVESQILAMAERFLKAFEQLMYPNTETRPTQPSGPNPDYVGDEPSPPDDEEIPF